MDNNFHIQQEPENNHSDEVSISKKTIYTVAAILGVALLGIGIYFGFFHKKQNKPPVNTVSVSVTDSTNTPTQDTALAKTDSATQATKEEEYYGEEESPYSEYRVIAKTLPVATGQLKFGDVVYSDETKSTESSKVIYLQNPATATGGGTAYTVNANYLIYDYRFEDYKKNFSLAPFSDLGAGVKKLLLESNYSSGNSYAITQNAERAKSSVAFGDFDGDGQRDVAVLMDNNEKQISRLLVICINSATKQPYLAFAENYSDKMKINSFKKGASVFMNSDEFSGAPQDGIIAQAEDVKIAIIYDKDLQKFKTYYQE